MLWWRTRRAFATHTKQQVRRGVVPYKEIHKYKTQLSQLRKLWNKQHTEQLASKAQADAQKLIDDKIRKKEKQKRRELVKKIIKQEREKDREKYKNDIQLRKEASQLDRSKRVGFSV
jgi:putative cell wall-binding protein